MRNHNFTRQERNLRLWLRFLTFVFLLVGVVFAMSPNYFPHYIDSVGAIFFNFQSDSFDSSKQEMWWILTLASMGGLIYASFKAQINLIADHSLIQIIIIIKGLAGLGFLLLFLLHANHFFYLIASIADGFLFITTLFAYVQALKSRSAVSYR